MCSSTAFLSLVLALGATATPVAPPAACSPGAPERSGTVFLTKDEALTLAFPDCDVARGTETLTRVQKKRVAKLAGTGCDRSLVFPYVATREGRLVGTAYFDVHRVRTLRETVMVVVDAKDRISRIEVLAFGEPQDYLPRAKWYAQFIGQRLDKKLSMKHGIKGIAGATLTARATTNAARRVLAVHQVLKEADRK